MQEAGGWKQEAGVGRRAKQAAEGRGRPGRLAAAEDAVAGVALVGGGLRVEKAVLGSAAGGVAGMAARAAASGGVNKLPAGQERVPVVSAPLLAPPAFAFATPAAGRAGDRDLLLGHEAGLGQVGVALHAVLVLDGESQPRGLNSRMAVPGGGVARAQQLRLDAANGPRPRVTVDAARLLRGVEAREVRCLGGDCALVERRFRLGMAGGAE